MTSRNVNRLPRLPSLDLLRGFEAAARHLSFSRAAAELFVTQSAISKQIRALEEAVGRPLFRRYNRRLELTEAGLALFDTSANVIAQLNEAFARMGVADASHPLTVSTTVSFASLWLVPRLPDFRRTYPGADVRISANNANVDLERDRIDLAIRFCDPRRAPPGAVRLAGERVFPVCSPRLLRLRDRPLRTPADLRRHVLLHVDDASGRWPWLNWSQWLEVFKLPAQHAGGALRFSHYDQLVRAALDGEGVALGRDPLLRGPLAKGDLVAPFGHYESSTREYFLISSQAAERSEAARRFSEWILGELRDSAAPAAGRVAGRRARARHEFT